LAPDPACRARPRTPRSAASTASCSAALGQISDFGKLAIEPLVERVAFGLGSRRFFGRVWLFAGARPTLEHEVTGHPDAAERDRQPRGQAAERARIGHGQDFRSVALHERSFDRVGSFAGAKPTSNLA